MKTILFFLSMLFYSATYAHHVVQSCAGNGRVKMVCTDFQDGGKTHVKISLQNGTWGNGSSDTLFSISPDYAFTIYVPTGAGLVTFKNTNHSGKANGEVYAVQTISCTSLPLKFGAIKARKLSAAEGQVTFTVYDVESVSHINVMVSMDNKTYSVRAVIFPTEGKEEKTYYINFKL